MRRWLLRLRAFNRRLAWALGHLAGATLGALVAVVSFDVLCRQVLDWPLLWPSEIAILLFVWSVMAGAAVAAQRRSHFIVDIFSNGLPPSVERTLGLAVGVFALLFAVVVVFYGCRMALDGLSRFTPMNGFRMIYHFLAIPLCGAAILLFELERLLDVPGAGPAGDGGSRS